jgi:hypothetical protein
VSATQLAPPPPAALEMSLPACYAQATGALYCFVEARNPLPGPVENVSARVTLAGPDGLPFASGVAYAAADVIPPGGAAPLVASFPPGTGPDIAASAVDLLTADPADLALAEGRALLLEIPTHTGRADDTRFSVQGEVRNGGAQAAGSAWLTLTLYAEDGAIVGYRKHALAGGLAAGEARAFSLTADSLGGPVHHYGLLAEGRP